MRATQTELKITVPRNDIQTGPGGYFLLQPRHYGRVRSGCAE